MSESVLTNPLVLERVFHHLPPADIKNSYLVSRYYPPLCSSYRQRLAPRYWRQLLDVPRYWGWAVVRVTSQRSEVILQSEILARVSNVMVESLPPAQLQAVLRTLELGEHIKCLRDGLISVNVDSLPHVKVISFKTKVSF